MLLSLKHNLTTICGNLYGIVKGRELIRGKLYINYRPYYLGYLSLGHNNLSLSKFLHRRKT
ncbi:unnamed protein product [marine sediment metagenome]|uniref:Uncharacterized protein n=1 Tax=marine sediment metagenome TaxID=412755 RepID=X1JNB2_9ZZZZ